MADGTTTIAGNLTRDPELRYTPAGAAVCTIGVAMNRRWQNRQTNEWEEQVSFFNLVAWSSLAENIAESLSKGDRIVAFCTPEQRSWETTEGEKRSVVEFRVDDIGASLRFATVVATRTAKREGPFDSGPAAHGATLTEPPAEEGSFDDLDGF